MAVDATGVTTILSGDPIVQEAKRRWDRCCEWEANSRSRILSDVKFAHGDSDNGYQWPNSIRQSRDTDGRPCLTMNVIRQHNLQITNEARRNKSSIKVRALGNGATAEAAQVYSQLFRHIEYISNAQSAYTTARRFQVDGGIGWWRLITDYAGSDTFDQEIYIKRIKDPLSVYMDPDCQEEDCSDAKFAFVFDTVSKEEFDETYPKYKGLGTQQPLGVGSIESDWVHREQVRVCEYFRVVTKSDKLVSFVDPRDMERKNIKLSMMKGWPKEQKDKLLSALTTMIRDIEVPEIEWKLIAGEKIIDETIWLGKYIPLVRIIGEETCVDGLLDVKGHTRNMKDSQRMYNYNASSQVEFVALQGKSPWIAPAKAIEQFESMWNTANTVNHSVLIWNHVDDENPDTVIPPPMKQEPPSASPAYQAGMDTAFNQMMMTSGQWQNSMGMAGNERTGRAISERQEQSDTSVYHFQDNFAEGLRYTAKQIIDLICKIYDTKRVMQIMADDGEDIELMIDPAAKVAYQQTLGENGKIIKRIFNPNIGQFDIAADVGPSVGSRRQQTADAMSLVLTQAPQLSAIIGDLLLKNLDFDDAQEAARRLKRLVPKQALGEGMSDAEQKLTAQIQALSQALAKSLTQQGKSEVKLAGKAQMRDIDVYEAETGRIAALAKLMGEDSNGVRQLVEQLVQDALGTRITNVQKANADAVGDQDSDAPPLAGARQAPDGEWYLPDATRPGKYLQVMKQQQASGVPRA